jgi:predicted transposase YdaD
VALRVPRRKRTAVPHDQGYKRLFSHAAAVEELLRGFLREDWADRLDFSTLERVGSSFVSDDLRERHSDLIWRLRLRGGDDEWCYLLLELQSTSYHFMAVRLSSYVALLQEEVIRKEKLRTGDRLPLVLPVVFYNGERPWRAPKELRQLYGEVAPGPRRWQPGLRYILLDVRRLKLDRPELAGNWMAMLLRIDICPDPERLPRLAEKLALLLPPDQPELRRTITVWLDSMFRRTLPGAIIPMVTDLGEADMLEQTLKRWAKHVEREGRKEGRREGRKEGEILGMRKLVLQMLNQRFGRLPVQVRQQVEDISTTRDLRVLSRRILTAETLRDTGLG